MLTPSPPLQPPPEGSALRWRGAADPSLLRAQHRRGRRRRWVYAAAGDDEVTVGAAVVDVGLLGLGTAFAFATTPAGTVLWDAGPGRAGRVGGLLGTAAVQRRRGTVTIDSSLLHIDVAVDGGRLLADVRFGSASPVSLLTPTARGGWNATTKAAGHRASGEVATPSGSWTVTGGAWTDATDGRQDGRTVWRWAAGAGTDAHGTPVGIQVSTGMNAMGPGENLVWWDGVAHPLLMTTLAPTDDGNHAGTWSLAGVGWSLELEPAGVRAASEGLGPIQSRYTQPIGRWHGTLPGPDGRPRVVTLQGVAEDHEARW